jgi:hypothetical protein
MEEIAELIAEFIKGIDIKRKLVGFIQGIDIKNKLKFSDEITYESIIDNSDLVPHAVLKKIIDSTLPNNLRCAHRVSDDKKTLFIGIAAYESYSTKIKAFLKSKISNLELSENDKNNEFPGLLKPNIVIKLPVQKFLNVFKDSIVSLWQEYSFLYLTWNGRSAMSRHSIGENTVIDFPLLAQLNLIGAKNSVVDHTRPHYGRMLKNLFASNPLLILAIRTRKMKLSWLIRSEYSKNYKDYREQIIQSGKIEILDGKVTIVTAQGKEVAIETKHLDWNKLLGFISIDEANQLINLIQSYEQFCALRRNDLMWLINAGQEINSFSPSPKLDESDEILRKSWFDLKCKESLNANQRRFSNHFLDIVFKRKLILSKEYVWDSKIDKFFEKLAGYSELLGGAFGVSENSKDFYIIHIENVSRAIPFIKEAFHVSARLEREQQLKFLLQAWHQRVKEACVQEEYVQEEKNDLEALDEAEQNIITNLKFIWLLTCLGST